MCPQSVSVIQCPALHFCSVESVLRFLCVAHLPWGQIRHLSHLCCFLLCLPQRELSCVSVAWQSGAVCLDYVPFSSFTDLFQQSPHASWRPSSTWAATRMWRRRKWSSGGCFPFTCVSPPTMATLQGCPSPRGVKGELICSYVYFD